MLIGIALVLLFSMSASGGGDCPPAQLHLGICTNNDGTTVTVGGEQTTPGSGGGTGGGSGNETTPPPPIPPWCAIDDPSMVYVTECITNPTPSTPTVTITDLVQFTPPPSPITVEPSNIAIVGLPSNFIATTSRVVNMSGTLFGRDVQIRFTPDLHRFSYGDGTTKTVATKGRTWAAAGQAQFTATATSHVYAARGTYTVRVDILYLARVNFGTGWRDVSGHVTARGPERQIRTYATKAALVAHTCNEVPTAAGC